MSGLRATVERNPGKAAGAGGIAGVGVGIALAMAALPAEEGYRLKAYPDSGGKWTICEGLTEGVKKGDVATPQQCLHVRNRYVVKMVARMDACLKVPVSPLTAKAMILFAFNVGTPAFCKRVAANFNDGKAIAGCTWMLRYVYDNGKWVRGLALRRARENGDCLKGLAT